MLIAGALLGFGVAQGSIIALVFIPAVVGLFAAAVWPRQTLLIMLAYIPLESFLLKWIPGGQGGALSLAPEAVLFVAGVSALVRGSAERHSGSRWTWLIWIGAFVVIGVTSGVVAGIPLLDIVYWVRTNVRYMTAALIVGAAGDRIWWVTKTAVVVAAGAVVQMVVALAEFIGGTGMIRFFAPASVVVGGRQFVSEVTSGGVAGTLGFYNNFGLYCSLSSVVCLGALVAVSEDKALALRIPRIQRTLLGAGAASAAIGTLISGSRQSIVALVGSAIVMVAIVGVRRLGNRLIPLVFVFGTLVAAALLMPSLTGPLAWIPQRFATAVSSSAVNQSLQTDRLFAISRVVPAVLKMNPLLGLGPGALSSDITLGLVASLLSLSSEGIYYSQDVGWAGMLVQLGIAGLTAILVLMTGLIMRSRKLFRRGEFDHAANATVLATMLVWALGMVASSPLFMRSVSLLLWTIAGLCLGGYDAREEVDAES